MVTEQELNNAIEIAKEEIADIDTPSKDELKDFKKRLDQLLDLLIEEAENPVDPDE